MVKEPEPVKAPEVAGNGDAVAAAAPFNAGDAMEAIVKLLDKSVKLKETRMLMGRLLRQTAQLRKHMTAADLRSFLTKYVSEDSGAAADLVQYLPDDGGAAPMDADAPASTSGPAAAAQHSPLPEVDMYAYLLVLIHKIDNKQWEQAMSVANSAVAKLRAFNRRTLDVIAARLYFYYSWTYERCGVLEGARSTLMAAHRTAVLRHDAVGQETLLNLLLRNYLHYNLYDQAEKFRAKAQVGEGWRCPQQYARYLFYLGTIRAVGLSYSESKEVLAQAVRKAPGSAAGFVVAASKWLILVRLLLGEIPERTEFSVPGMAVPLAPYLELTAAVRSGDLAAFQQVAAKYAEVFRGDKTRHLITRLRHNVIRTGLRRIITAYSRISLEDVAAKLHLPSAEDAEFIVAKAIRDGGIDATLDHAGRALASKEVADVYSTGEPQAAFHARIAFCLDVHNEAVKAMRFEPGAHKAALAAAEGRKGRKTAEAELAEALEEEEEDL